MKNSSSRIKSNIFGREVEKLTPDLIVEMLSEAEDQAQAAVQPDIECVLDVLNDVAECWQNPEYHLRRKAARILPELTSFSHEMVEEGLSE